MASRDHYHKYFEGEVDVYRICRLYDIEDPAIYHAVKKLLRFGDTDSSRKEEVEGAILALERWLTMEDEDENGNHSSSEPRVEVDPTSIAALTDRIQGLNKTEAQSLVNKVGNRDDIADYPFFSGMEERKTREWLRFIEEDGREEVKTIVDQVMYVE